MHMIVFAIGLYTTVSISVVYVNHAIFTQSLKYPVFVSWFQQIAGLPIYIALSYLGQAVPSLAFFPVWKFNSDVALKVTPLSMLFVGMIGFSNTCLKNVQVSTYQVARSMTLLFNIVLSYYVLG